MRNKELVVSIDRVKPAVLPKQERSQDNQTNLMSSSQLRRSRQLMMKSMKMKHIQNTILMKALQEVQEVEDALSSKKTKIIVITRRSASEAGTVVELPFFLSFSFFCFASLFLL